MYTHLRNLLDFHSTFAINDGSELGEKNSKIKFIQKKGEHYAKRKKTICTYKAC